MSARPNSPRRAPAARPNMGEVGKYDAQIETLRAQLEQAREVGDATRVRALTLEIETLRARDKFDRAMLSAAQVENKAQRRAMEAAARRAFDADKVGASRLANKAAEPLNKINERDARMLAKVDSDAAFQDKIFDLEEELEKAKEEKDAAQVRALTLQIARLKAQGQYEEDLISARDEANTGHRRALEEKARKELDIANRRAARDANLAMMRIERDGAGGKGGKSKAEVRDNAIRARLAMMNTSAASPIVGRALGANFNANAGDRFAESDALRPQYESGLLRSFQGYNMNPVRQMDIGALQVPKVANEKRQLEAELEVARIGAKRARQLGFGVEKLTTSRFQFRASAICAGGGEYNMPINYPLGFVAILETSTHFESFHRLLYNPVDSLPFLSRAISFQRRLNKDFSAYSYPIILESSTEIYIYATDSYPIPENAKEIFHAKYTIRVLGGKRNSESAIDYIDRHYEFYRVDGVSTVRNGGNLIVPDYNYRETEGEHGNYYFAIGHPYLPHHLCAANLILRVVTSKDEINNEDVSEEANPNFSSHLLEYRDQIAVTSNQANVLTYQLAIFEQFDSQFKISVKTFPQLERFHYEPEDAWIVSDPQIIELPDSSHLIAVKCWPQGQYKSWRLFKPPSEKKDFAEETIIFTSLEFRHFSLIGLQSNDLACAAIGYFESGIEVRFKRTNAEKKWPDDSDAILVFDYGNFEVDTSLSLIELPDGELRIYGPFNQGFCYHSTNGGAEWTQFNSELYP